MSFLHMTRASYFSHTHTYFHLFVFNASDFFSSSDTQPSNTHSNLTRSSKKIARATYSTENSLRIWKIFWVENLQQGL